MARPGHTSTHLSQQYADGQGETQPDFPIGLISISIPISAQINHNQHLSHNTQQRARLVENNVLEFKHQKQQSLATTLIITKML